MAEPIKKSGWMKAIFALSIALNLLFIGVFAGASWRYSNGKGGAWQKGGPGLESYGAAYVRALPKADRRALHQAIRADHPQTTRKARRAAYGEVLQVLRAEPFDATRIEGVLASQRSVVEGVQGSAQTKWLALIKEMSPTERSAYADRLEEVLARGKRHKRRKPRE